MRFDICQKKSTTLHLQGQSKNQEQELTLDVGYSCERDSMSLWVVQYIVPVLMQFCLPVHVYDDCR